MKSNKTVDEVRLLEWLEGKEGEIERECGAREPMPDQKHRIIRFRSAVARQRAMIARIGLEEIVEP